MQVVVKRDEFLNLLYLTNTIVERKNTMPILANVKLHAADNKLTVSATDLEVSLIGDVTAKVSTPGTITVSAKFIHDIIRELTVEDVKLEVSKGERLEVKAGSSLFKVNGISSEEFPTIMGVSLNKPFSVEAAKLYTMFEHTAYAVSTDETRYNINGVYIEPIMEGKNPFIRFVATDGHRLALIEREADGMQFERGVIIPRKGIQEVKKILETNDGAAKVGIENGFFTVESKNVTLGIRLIDGEFPDYRQVIPNESNTKVTIERDEFLSTLKRVSLVTTDRSRSVRFKLTQGVLHISSSSPELGEASESMSVQQDGDDVQVGFSARYLIEALIAMQNSEQIFLKLSGELGPAVFSGSADELYTCVVMPMRFD